MYLFQPDRYLLHQQIKKYAGYITGSVLDVGAGKFSRYRHLFDCQEYIKMDVETGENIDVVGHAEKIPFPDHRFDAIICTQVLGDVPEPGQALHEFYRVLKRGGVVLLTESFMNEMHDEPVDYWRFTKFGLENLFVTHGFEIISLDQRGGFFTVNAQYRLRYLFDRWHLHRHRWARLLNPFFKLYGRLMIWRDRHNTSDANSKYSLGWCIVARKK